MREGCAHRFLPCGTRLWIEDQRTHLSSTCTVVDRGPYGAVHHGRWVVKRRPDAPGNWRGILDVMPPVARRLGLRGLDPVVLHVLQPRLDTLDAKRRAEPLALANWSNLRESPVGAEGSNLNATNDETGQRADEGADDPAQPNKPNSQLYNVGPSPAQQE